jgi:hypothetical protein
MPVLPAAARSVTRAYDGSVADEVTADPRTGRLTGDGWSLHADQVEVVEGDGWHAVIGIRRDLKLLVTWDGHPDWELDVEAWAAAPQESDGVAVIDLGDGDIRLARVPLCGCGDRGCGNAGVQLRTRLPAHDLPALVDVLRDLPWTHTIPTHGNVLHGSVLAAVEGPADG